MILPSYKSDHCVIKIEVNQDPELKRGPGFWKLNVSLIADLANVQSINRCIDEEYNQSLQYDVCYRWERVKASIVKKCQMLGRVRAEKANKEFKLLYEQKVNLQNRLNQVQNMEEAEKETVERQMDECVEKIYLWKQKPGVRGFEAILAGIKKVKKVQNTSLD